MREFQTFRQAPSREPGRLLGVALTKALCLLVLGALSCLFPPPAQAGPIVVNNATGCKVYTCIPITSLNSGSVNAFGTAPYNLNGTLHFTNMSGVNWTKLTLTETGAPAASITCSSNLFNCSVVAYGSNGAVIILTSGGAMKGIAAGQSFEIACHGPCPTQLQINAVAASEPSGLLLLLAALAAIFGWKVFSRFGVWNAWPRRAP